MDPDELRAQLSPGWSPVNIALVVILTWLFLPFGLAMIAYILWGDRVGLDFSQPGAFGRLAQKLKQALRGAVEGFSGNPGQQHQYRPTGTPNSESDSFETWRQQEEQKLREERAALDREREAFDADKKRSR